MVEVVANGIDDFSWQRGCHTRGVLDNIGGVCVWLRELSEKRAFAKAKKMEEEKNPSFFTPSLLGRSSEMWRRGIAVKQYCVTCDRRSA